MPGWPPWGERPSGAGLAFAGLHQLLRPVLAHLGDLPPWQRTALGAAFGMGDVATPEPFLIALAALRLLSEAAARRAHHCGQFRTSTRQTSQHHEDIFPGEGFLSL